MLTVLTVNRFIYVWHKYTAYKKGDIVVQPNAKYVKTNVTPDSNRVLRLMAAEQGKFIYEIVDDILRAHYSDYFRKTGY